MENKIDNINTIEISHTYCKNMIYSETIFLRFSNYYIEHQ